MEALFFGVPCLCVPQMDEQVFTAGQMVKLGLASASLTREQVTVESLREGILALINDPQYKANAQAMADEMHNYGGCERAAQAVIDFVKSGK
jgi:UDP:flavonoid glycosyltransferase YjiC (YdhE family)